MSACQHGILGSCSRCEREAYDKAMQPVRAMIDRVRRVAVLGTEPCTKYDGETALFVAAHLTMQDSSARAAVELVTTHLLRAIHNAGEP